MSDERQTLIDTIETLIDALEIIAGEKQCIDNLMSSGDVARFALKIARGNLVQPSTGDEERQGVERMTEGFNHLRSALSWFASHEVEKKLGHLPQWVVMGRKLTGNR